MENVILFNYLFGYSVHGIFFGDYLMNLEIYFVFFGCTVDFIKLFEVWIFKKTVARRPVLFVAAGRLEPDSDKKIGLYIFQKNCFFS